MKQQEIYKIEVFITNIQNALESASIIKELHAEYPDLRVDVDLEDVDRVLRIEGYFDLDIVMKIIASKKHTCEIML
ncbi:hypothetical protein ACH3O9_03620 [Leeuwenhoekiella sp. A16]|uniref:hypothetical protein n=1 Tax=unclassified Leeuwenhoekiella TaxID=2615029 RepID=UPI003A8089CB